jgi:hypothetical protein
VVDVVVDVVIRFVVWCCMSKLSLIDPYILDSSCTSHSSLNSRVLTMLIIWVLALAEILKVGEADVPIWNIVSLVFLQRDVGCAYPAVYTA